VIVVVTGTPKEIAKWAKEHNLTEKDYIRVRRPTTLKTFMPGTDYVTVGEWVWYAPSEHSKTKTMVRKTAYPMILAAECAGLRLRADLAE
jgi:hypothetical protein